MSGDEAVVRGTVVAKIHRMLDTIEARNAEIERLRAEIKRLRAAGDEMVDAATRQQWSRLDVAVANWQEARRG